MASQKSLMSQEELQFRLSKKVAELTKVVHLLFTKNREKELEVEAVKEAYEKEIAIVIADAKTRISKLENDNIQQQQAHQSELQQLHEEYSQQLLERDEALNKKDLSFIDQRNQLVRDNESLNFEVKSLREERNKLIQKMNKDIGELSSERDDIDIKLNQEIEDLKQELKKAKNRIHDLTENLKDSSKDTTQQIESLTKELNEVRQSKEANQNKVKKLEADIKTLKRKLEDKNRISPKSEVYRVTQKYENEIAKLKREIQKFRMELLNREDNYNRVFAEQQPILIDQTTIKLPNYPSLQLSMKSREKISSLPSLDATAAIVGNKYSKKR
ncbi:uncharacterized protein TRIADDRAFT_54435 [Trichoplax adhaerens]|uniref:Uncharacterized protein n=1 Tax=Trichoplax adhaerens TaxID=10228 RepID=B3RS10_TRIAD|nr:hypothetical protein TRIADDRAFT_54435 [Trichoplax adhaerens]EDV26966.1 hypothetical protein TRIADDRAFT_54435 [Trichoplax adhaerens]|eukprot:XP_002110962.1 hypothetical protein TRIADDRAFT_54435 [Trichoplax adhaerens]